MPPQSPATGGASLDGTLGVFDSVGSALEDLVGAVKSIPEVAKEAAHYAYFIAKASLGLAAGFAMGGLPALILPVGMSIGTAYVMHKSGEQVKFKDAFKRIANELTIGGILGGLIGYYFTGTANLGKIVEASYGAKAAMLTRLGCAVPYVPGFLATHEYLNRALMSDYKSQPIKDIGKKIMGPMKWIVPIILANFALVPYYFDKARQTVQMSLAATNSIIYGMLKTEKKEVKKPEMNPNELAQAMQQYGGV